MATRNRTEFSLLVAETKPKILSMLTANGKMKPINIRNALDSDESLIRISLEQMKNEGLVESTGRYYQIKSSSKMLARTANSDLVEENRRMVWQEDQEIVTDSLTIAAYFEKEHRTVLQAIRDYLDSPDENVKVYALHNFMQSNYLDSQGKSQLKFNVPRGGFGLVALGFSGLKADRIRVKFLQQFDQYEAQIKKIIAQDNVMISTLLERHEETFRILTTGQVTITKEISEVKEEVGGIKRQVARLDEKVSNVTPIRRYDFPESVLKIWLRIIIEFFQGYCPVCLMNKIVENGKWIIGAVQFCHINDRDMNKVTDGIPACLKCHAEHRDSEGGRFKQAVQIQSWLQRVFNYVNFRNRKQQKLDI
jgi:Rha family phage regulatory protein